jgi:hypothetical protein
MFSFPSLVKLLVRKFFPLLLNVSCKSIHVVDCLPGPLLSTRWVVVYKNLSTVGELHFYEPVWAFVPYLLSIFVERLPLHLVLREKSSKTSVVP